MAPLYAAFGISRKTGYKIFDRYKDCGLQAFTDRSRRPYRQANRLPAQLEALIIRLKREYLGGGAPKIREKLRRQSTAPHLPAISTVHGVLDRHGQVRRRRRRRQTATGTELSRPTTPNALWCAYKGEFMLGNRRYCYPLTVTDFASRYLLTCEALSTTQETFAFTAFERTFKDFGLPGAIRTDNGVPFASGHALYRLTAWVCRCECGREALMSTATLARMSPNTNCGCRHLKPAVPSATVPEVLQPGPVVAATATGAGDALRKFHDGHSPLGRVRRVAWPVEDDESECFRDFDPFT
jgi:putative transposase